MDLISISAGLYYLNSCILDSYSLVRISPWAALRPFCLTPYLVPLLPVVSTSPVSDTFGNPPIPWSARP
jgi:hypothetical protein